MSEKAEPGRDARAGISDSRIKTGNSRSPARRAAAGLNICRFHAAALRRL